MLEANSMADNPGQNTVKVCGDAEAKTTADLLDKNELEAAYKLFVECWNGDEVAFQKYALKTNAFEKNNIGNDFSIVFNDRFSRVTPSTSGRGVYMDTYKFE
jgi:hypothetical protein